MAAGICSRTHCHCQLPSQPLQDKTAQSVGDYVICIKLEMWFAKDTIKDSSTSDPAEDPRRPSQRLPTSTCSSRRVSHPPVSPIRSYARVDRKAQEHDSQGFGDVPTCINLNHISGRRQINPTVILLVPCSLMKRNY